MKIRKFNYISLALITGVLISCSNKAIELSKYKDDVRIHTDLQDEYLNDNYEAATKYAFGVEELSRPKPIELSWKTRKKDITGFKVKISETKDFTDAIEIETKENKASIYNLKIATTYYWNVEASYESSTAEISDTESFKIESFGPRNLYIDGITNARDVGGWPIDDTHRVRQGLFFRSGRLNQSNASTIIKEVTSEGEKVLLEDLKIKSEMDLRTIDDNEVGAITSSVLGDSVTYFSCPMDWHASNILEGNKEMVQHIFSDILADENSYPLIFHCNIGTDRTGMIAYLLNGLLGVEDEYLFRDYLFSNFGNIGGARTMNNIKNNYVATIKRTEGNTLSE